MSRLIPFEFESASIRVVIDENGDPWFVGKDICESLGYKDPTTAMKSHCRGVQKLHPIVDTLGRKQDARILSESDVLRLIVSSTLPEAENFERLVFEEILPSIRKTGSYSAKNSALLPQDYIQANEVFTSNLSVAKLIFDGNQAVLSANRATVKTTGVDVLSNLGATALIAETKEALLTPADIGIQLSLSAQKVNKLIEAAGLQQCLQGAKNKKIWDVTAAGAKYAEVLDTGKKHGNGTPIKQNKWYSSVIGLIT
ncbi:Bro-N domain-containing protein [Methylomonas sp. 2BW1-5-20]|uniref:BRO-N domain-containing protein n=1 Tax=Methylomonas sp. 2BW1-5-20 TaxID=3376686 RepID=UPI00404C3523